MRSSVRSGGMLSQGQLAIITMLIASPVALQAGRTPLQVARRSTTRYGKTTAERDYYKTLRQRVVTSLKRASAPPPMSPDAGPIKAKRQVSPIAEAGHELFNQIPAP